MNPQELKNLFGDNANAIERMLLVTMLQEALAGSPVAGAALHGVMEHTQPVTLDVDQMKTRYGGSEWTVEHLKEVLADTTTKYVEAKNAATGWCVPQRGDRLRLVKPVGNLIYGYDWIAVGDIVTCEAIGACIDLSIPVLTDGQHNWLLQARPGVQILKPDDKSLTACLPLDCFEPVTETNKP